MTRAPYFREAVFWALILVVGLTYFGAGGAPPFTSRQPQGYYGALTNAFLSGQVSLLERPDPRLVRAPNPYVPLLDVPRPHDMSLFQGRLYLYFGAAPVVILYLPWRLVTGRWLADPAGTTWFCFVGVVAAGCLLRRVRNRYFPGCRDAWVWLGLSVLAWGSPVYYLSQNRTFYAVPISCAFCCVMLAAAGTERALAAESPRVRNSWLALASLAFGLAVGSRPNYVFGLVTLLIPAAYLSRRRDLTPLIAALFPAALVGVAMAVYNFERFHDPFEFGMRFAMMPSDLRAFPIMGLAYLPANILGYLFRGATYVRYFPFFLNDGTYGLLPYLPFCVLGVLACGAGARLRSGFGVLVAMVAGVAACNLLSLGLFFYFGEQRYMADIAPMALLFGGLGCLATMGSPRGHSRQVAMGVAVVALGLFSITNGSLASLQTFTGVVPSAVKRLDSVSLWAERVAGAGYGPIEFSVQFPPNRVGHREPLLTTGLPGRADIIFVEYLATDRARLGFFHSGSGGPVGQPFQIGPGPHRLTVGMGSLYPPADSPLFRGLAPGYAADLKKLLQVSIDELPVLTGNEGFYFATPGLTFTGSNHVATDVSDPAFTGQISSGRRLGLPPAKEVAPGLGFAGPIRLHVRFANDRVGPSEPLVSTGSHDDGACLFVTYLGPNRIRFGLESRGSVVTSDPVATDLAWPHVVDVELGSLYPPGHGFVSPAEAETLRSRLSVRLDGNLVMMARRDLAPADPRTVTLGYNEWGSSSAAQAFSGSIDGAEPFVGPPARPEGAWGPLDAEVLLPSPGTAGSEPVVVTGRAGRGDVIFVSYVDGSHIRFGFDHWSVGGPLGPVLETDYQKVHHLQVSMASLDPLAATSSRHSRVQVSWDDHPVFDVEALTYAANAGEVNLWANPIGASSCGPRFTGTVLESDSTAGKK